MSFEKTMHVNGKVIPVDSTKFKDVTYLGHYLSIEYEVDIEQTTTFTKDKVNIDELGNFNFRLPIRELISSSIFVKMFAPNGDMLANSNYTYSIFKPKEIAFGAEEFDSSSLFQIKVNPQKILEEANSLKFEKEIAINGVLIDSSGTQELSNVQLIIWGIENEVDEKNPMPLLSVYTDNKGKFFTKIKNMNLLKAYVTVTGENDLKLEIKLDGEKIPTELLLVADFNDIDVKVFKGKDKTLPEHNRLLA